MHGSDQDEIEYNKHKQNDVNNFVQIRNSNRPEFEIEEDEHEEEFEQSEDQENNDDLEETQELIKQFHFIIRCVRGKDATIDIDINKEKMQEIINYKITNGNTKKLRFLKDLQAQTVCEVLCDGYNLCDLRTSDFIDSNDNVLIEQAVKILLDSKKFVTYWFPSKELGSDLVNNVNDNKYFFVKFNSNNKLLFDVTFKNKDKEEETQKIPLSMCLANEFIAKWYNENNLDKHKDKKLQDRFGAIMQYLDYSLRSYSLYNKDENKTKFNDAADFVLKGIVEPCYDLLCMEISSNSDYSIKDVSYRYSILNLVRMYELCRDSHATPTVAVMKYFNDQEYYLGNGLVTEEDMQNVLNKYKENFANKQKKSQNSSLHKSEDDSNDNSDNENDEKENKSEMKFNSFLGLNQENSNSVSHDLKDGVKKTIKKNNNNDITKPVVENMSSSPPQLNKKAISQTTVDFKNHSVSGGTKSQPVNNKPAETNKSDKSNKVEDPSTQKFKEKSEDKKDVENKVQNVKKDKQNKKINNTRSKLNNEEQKNQTSNAYTYLFIALGVIVVSVIAFLIYRNFVSNVASSESLQNYAANLLSV